MLLFFFLLAQGGMPGTYASGMSSPLYSPDHWVVCNRERAVCYDRYGASIGLTQAFLGQDEADRLAGALLAAPPQTLPEPVFSVADDVICRREIGPCYAQGRLDPELTTVLYGPWASSNRQNLKEALRDVDWKWQESRYSNATHVAPADPSRYLLYLENNGTLRIRADCNRASGKYRLERKALSVEIGPITRAACGPESLDTVFLRDLSAAFGVAVNGDQLLLDILDVSGTGTMQFGR